MIDLKVIMNPKNLSENNKCKNKKKVESWKNKLGEKAVLFLYWFEYKNKSCDVMLESNVKISFFQFVV